ncbi:MAG: hypothetical protein V3W52_17135 [Syntrophobacteria bacterium]
MSEIKVVGWGRYEDESSGELSFSIMGGFIGDGDRWQDYLDGTPEECHKYAEAIRVSVIKNNIRITGEQHQYDSEGAPVFSDGATTRLSYRAWGDLMAAIWAEHEDSDYNYMSFYMSF